MKDFAVFWGCTIQTRFPFIEKSTRMVLESFKLPYRDIDGFTCCPEKSLVNNVDHGAFVVTAARNVALVDELGYDLVSPCKPLARAARSGPETRTTRIRRARAGWRQPL